jgi:hypothetical protein
MNCADFSFNEKEQKMFWTCLGQYVRTISAPSGGVVWQLGRLPMASRRGLSVFLGVGVELGHLVGGGESPACFSWEAKTGLSNGPLLERLGCIGEPRPPAEPFPS